MISSSAPRCPLGLVGFRLVRLIRKQTEPAKSGILFVPHFELRLRGFLYGHEVDFTILTVLIVLAYYWLGN